MAKSPDGNDNKAYIRQAPSESIPVALYHRYLMGLAPRFFVFGYNGWKKANGLETNFRALSQENEGAHIHGVCNLYNGGSLSIRHLAFQEGEDRFSQATQNGFRYFLMQLPATLDSMLPAHRLGLGFDQIDLDHYALAIG